MTIFHHVLHFLFLALSGAATLIPLFVRNNKKLNQLESDVEALKAFVQRIDPTIGK